MRELTLTFRGAEYRVPASKAFALADAIEDVATLQDIVAMLSNPKFAKFARVLGVALRFAGARATDQEVYGEIMAQVRSAKDTGAAPVFPAEVASIMAMLMDEAPDSLKGAGDDGPKAAAAS